MKYFIDIANFSLNKYGEELCGDNVEIIRREKDSIVVLSDGLGSGVKANILATLTSKIAITMLKEGARIEETIDTITNTLPECKERRLAYSTFTILRIKNNGRVYMVEYENPTAFVFRRGNNYPLEKYERIVNGKKILESNFKLKEGDLLVAVSDGVIHAGVGQLLNLGWQWENVNDYLKDLSLVEKYADNIGIHLVNICNNLYNSRPGDDTTVVAVKVLKRSYMTVFAGVPKDKEDDDKMIDLIKKAIGKKVLCGGTTANIIARALDKEIVLDLDTYTKDIPPIGYLDGFDLVTEGLLTLTRAVKILKQHQKERLTKQNLRQIEGNDGATKLVNLFLKQTDIKIYVGKAINPAHQNPDFPSEFNLKINVVLELQKVLLELGKIVEVSYL